MLKPGLKAGAIVGVILFTLFLLLFVIGLLSPDVAVIVACFVLLLALPLFVIAGRLAARFSGGSAPGAGALAAVVALLMATPAFVSLVLVETVSRPQLMTDYMNSDTTQSLENSGVSTEDFSALAGMGGSFLTCLTLGPIIAASLGSIGGRVRQPETRQQRGRGGANVQPQQPVGGAIGQVQLQQPAGLVMGQLEPQQSVSGGTVDMQPEQTVSGETSEVQPEPDAPGFLTGCFNVVMVILVVTGMCVAVGFWVESGTPDRTVGYAEDFFNALFGGTDGGDGQDVGGGASGYGGVRNCIKPVFPDNPIECSDYDGVPKPTTLNGRDIGVCRSVDDCQ